MGLWCISLWPPCPLWTSCQAGGVQPFAPECLCCVMVRGSCLGPAGLQRPVGSLVLSFGWTQRMAICEDYWYFITYLTCSICSGCHVEDVCSAVSQMGCTHGFSVVNPIECTLWAYFWEVLMTTFKSSSPLAGSWGPLQQKHFHYFWGALGKLEAVTWFTDGELHLNNPF